MKLELHMHGDLAQVALNSEANFGTLLSVLNNTMYATQIIEATFPS